MCALLFSDIVASHFKEKIHFICCLFLFYCFFFFYLPISNHLCVVRQYRCSLYTGFINISHQIISIHPQCLALTGERGGREGGGGEGGRGLGKPCTEWEMSITQGAWGQRPGERCRSHSFSLFVSMSGWGHAVVVYSAALVTGCVCACSGVCL